MSSAYHGNTQTISIKTDTSVHNAHSIVAAFVPVVNFNDSRQQITTGELKNTPLYVSTALDSSTKSAIAQLLGVDSSKLQALHTAVEKLPIGTVALITAKDLNPKIKLLKLNDDYYLDSFHKGAVFQYVLFDGKDADPALSFNDLASVESILKVNMTGVTALTRLMMKKLSSVSKATYFSQQIGPFLADADITHVSDEVSFKPGCDYSSTSFCSPPAMLEVLKASGVDAVELTGNHNNDSGNQYNTATINTYHQLGWHTFGGGLNAGEAAKPYIADAKGSKVAFLGYNYADSPSGAPIATATTAGSNSYDLEKIKRDVELAHQQSAFAIVDVQFLECYAYPDGYVEFPKCDGPIPKQRETFQAIIDAGADMVVGTQAHQPQTYEIYNGKPIYYGLGNLYFDQIQWPGTERGIILTHYFQNGKLLQTKLSPTVYDQAFQTHLMPVQQAQSFLDRLIKANN